MFDTATWMIWKKFRWKCAAVNVLKTSTLILLGFGVFPFLILLTRIVYLIFILSKGETSSIAGDSPSFRHFAIYTAVMSVLGIRESNKSHITLLPCCHSFLLSHCSSVLQLQPPAQAFYYEVCKPCSIAAAFNGDELLSAISLDSLDRCFVRSPEVQICDPFSFF